MEPISPNRTLRGIMISLACLAGAAGAGHLLYTDMTFNDEASSGPAMGKVERSRSDIRRKSAASYLWNSIQQGASIYRRDSLQSGEDSTATLRLKDGSSVELGENSLVVIDDLSLSPLNFLRGSFIVRSDKGDSLIRVDANGKPLIKKLPFRLLTPELRARVFTREHEKAQLTFTWEQIEKKAVGLSETARMEISSSSSFSKPLTQIPLKSAKPTLALQAGHYFWRLIQGKDEALTEVREFQVLEAAHLDTLTPSENEKIDTTTASATVRFQWIVPRAIDRASLAFAGIAHRIEVSESSDFKVISKHKNVALASGNATVTGIPLGHHYWRLKGQYGSFEALSPPRDFTVERQAISKISLITPTEGEFIDTKGKIRFHWVYNDETVQFRWDLEQFGRDTKVNPKTVGHSEIDSTVSEEEVLIPGDYRWRIQAFKDARRVGESEWQTFTISDGKPIALLRPAAGETIFHWNEPDNFIFTWQPPKAGSRRNYIVEVSQNEKFTSLISSPTVSTETFAAKNLTLPEGVLFWRVRELGENGNARYQSEVRSFRRLPHPPLEAPNQAEPPADFLFKLTSAESALPFRWTPVESASKYEVSLFDGGRLLRAVTTSEPKTEMVGLRVGKYQWTLRAIDPLGRPGADLPKRSLTVEYGSRLRAPRFDFARPLVVPEAPKVTNVRPVRTPASQKK